MKRGSCAASLSQGRSRQSPGDDSLEADWNGKLRALAATQEAYEKAKAADASVVTDAERAELMALTDFPRLWRDPRTQMKEKKRMLRLLIEDVTLTRGDALHVDVRFAGGATRSLDVPLPKSCGGACARWRGRQRDRPAHRHLYLDGEIADVLNERGVRTVVTTPWTAARISRLRTIYRLTHDRRTRLLAQGFHRRKMWPPAGMAPCATSTDRTYGAAAVCFVHTLLVIEQLSLRNPAGRPASEVCSQTRISG